MRTFWGCLGFLGLVASTAMGDTLTLANYLARVQSASGYQGASESEKALALQKDEADLMYSPQLVARAARNDNRDDQIVSTLNDNELIHRAKTDTYGVALVKKWKEGLTTSVNYDWTRVDSTADIGASTAFLVNPSASVTVSLWRDFLGKQSRAQSNQARYQTESARYSALHQEQQWLYQARVAYWNLQLARDTVTIRQDTLNRAVSIVAWSKRRSALRLGDDTEIIQARASQRVRELEYQQALEGEKAAGSDFNRFRGVPGVAVPETLEPLEASLTALAFQWPEKSPERWDVRSLEAQAQAKKAAWDSSRADGQPDMNAFATLAANGVDSTYGPASDESLKARRPNTLVGAQLTIPLDVFATKKVAKGYERGYRAALLDYEDKVLQTDQEWQRLQQRLTDVNQRLAMAGEIETIQKEKVEKEQQRLRAGRTTQYQVQSYEGDYSSARLQRLAIQAEKLSIWAEGEWILSADREKAASSEGASK